MRAARARALLAKLGVVACLFGCSTIGQLSPKAQQAVDTFDCYVAVVSPYVGDALDTAELVRDAIRGRADLSRALVMLGATAADVQAIDGAMRACLPGSELAPPPPELAWLGQ